MKKQIFFKIKIFIFIVLVFLKSFIFQFENAFAKNYKTLEKDTLIVGTNATFHPFEYKNEEGKIVGFDIDLINLIAQKLDVKIKIVDMPFDGLLGALGKKIDLVIAGLTKTEEREKIVDFSESYFESKQCILTTTNKQISKEEDLNNLTIATQIGTTANEYVKNLKQKYDTIKNKDYDEYDIMVEDLLKKRVDAVILDEIAAENQLIKHKNKLKKTNGSVLNCPIEFSCIAVAKNNNELLKDVNSAILEIKNSKNYSKMLSKHLNFKEIEEKQTKKNTLKSQFYSAFIEKSRYKLYLKGLLTTLTVTFFAAILGFFLGNIIAILKLIKNKKGKNTLISKIANLYTSVIRGTPVLVQLLIMWLIIFKNAKNGVFVAIVCFGLNSAAYVAEIMRGAIDSVEIGQTEAGISLGFSKFQTLFHIVLPQGLKNAILPLCNEIISLIKETAIVGYVALEDLTRAAFSISAASYQTFMPLILTALIYFLITKIASLILELIREAIKWLKLKI